MTEENKVESPKTENIQDKHKNICRFLSFVLRHKPQMAHLKLDEDGFADIQKVLSAIEDKFKLKLTEEELNSVTKKYAFNFFKIQDKKIKAKFGHTVILNMNTPQGFEPIDKTPRELYCTIDKKEMWNVSKNGLQGSLVQSDLKADKLKVSKGEFGTIVSINSDKASKNNVTFYFNKNNQSYHCKFIPATYLKFEL